jgi:branched-chain amino acid transport system permease protein
MQQFVQQVVAGLAEGSVFGSLALALVLIYKATEVINFAQGEMAMFTTYICWALLGHNTWHWWAFFATLGIAFVGGIGIYAVVIAPLQRAGILTVVMATIALLVIFNGLATWIWKPQLVFFPSPFPFSSWTIGGVHIAKSDVYTFLLVLACVGVLWAFFRFTKLGLAMRAGALNPAAARLLGVRTAVLLALGWGFAAALGAVSGMMIAPNISVSAGLQPSLMQAVLVYAFAAAVLGGLDSPIGAIVGGLVLGVGLNLLGAYVGFVKPELHLPLALAVLLVVLLVRPAGLLGKVTVRRV